MILISLLLVLYRPKMRIYILLCYDSLFPVLPLQMKNILKAELLYLDGMWKGLSFNLLSGVLMPSHFCVPVWMGSLL